MNEEFEKFWAEYQLVLLDHEDTQNLYVLREVCFASFVAAWYVSQCPPESPTGPVYPD